MFDLMKMGLENQALIAKANAEALTDADVQNITDAGLVVVHRPKVKTNVVSLEARRMMGSHTSPEAV
jgi:hypothetical protein